MKKLIYVSFIFLSLLSACKKDNNANPKSESKTSFNGVLGKTESELLENDKIVARIRLATQSNYSLTSNRNNHVFQVQGDFYDKPLDLGIGNGVDVGSLILNDPMNNNTITVPFNLASGFNYASNHYNPNPNFFGKEIDISHSGNTGLGYSAFNNVKMRIPEKIDISLISPTGSYINHTQSLTINWNHDINCPKTYIAVNYNIAVNTGLNHPYPDLNQNGKTWATEITSTSGTYTIPASVIQMFPVGSFIDIYIGRYQYTYENLAPNKLALIYAPTWNVFSKIVN